jgi:hypothetical protein
MGKDIVQLKMADNASASQDIMGLIVQRDFVRLA